MLDKLTYAGNPRSIAELGGEPRLRFVHGDIGDRAAIRQLLADASPSAIVHFAAESHVDRSIDGPEDFITTNVVGTFHLLEECAPVPAARQPEFRFLHVSTDEVFGALGATGAFVESTPYDPQIAVLRFEGRQRSPGLRVRPHLQVSGADHELLEQLRSVSVPREADPAHDPRTRSPAIAYRSTARARTSATGST